MRMNKYAAASALAALFGIGIATTAFADVKGWLNWRGPEGTGVSRETGLLDKVEAGGKNALWTHDISGARNPRHCQRQTVCSRLSRQSGPDLQEVLFCANADTGKMLVGTHLQRFYQ